MKFRTDKTKVHEGENFIVSWDCENPEMVSLTVEDGAKSQIPLPDNGSRTISASGNADKIVLTLHASIGGRVQVKKAVVKVTRNVVKTEKVHHRTRSSPGNKKIFDLSKIASWWNTVSFRMKTTRAYMPEDKRMAYITLGAYYVCNAPYQSFEKTHGRRIHHDCELSHVDYSETIAEEMIFGY